MKEWMEYDGMFTCLIFRRFEFIARVGISRNAEDVCCMSNQPSHNHGRSTLKDVEVSRMGKSPEEMD